MKMPAPRTRPYPPDFVDAEELAYRLSCSKSTVSSYVARGPVAQANEDWGSCAMAVGHRQRFYRCA